MPKEFIEQPGRRRSRAGDQVCQRGYPVLRPLPVQDDPAKCSVFPSRHSFFPSSVIRIGPCCLSGKLARKESRGALPESGTRNFSVLTHLTAAQIRWICSGQDSGGVQARVAVDPRLPVPKGECHPDFHFAHGHYRDYVFGGHLFPLFKTVFLCVPVRSDDGQWGTLTRHGSESPTAGIEPSLLVHFPYSPIHPHFSFCQATAAGLLKVPRVTTPDANAGKVGPAQGTRGFPTAYFFSPRQIHAKRSGPSPAAVAGCLALAVCMPLREGDRPEPRFKPSPLRSCAPLTKVRGWQLRLPGQTRLLHSERTGEALPNHWRTRLQNWLSFPINCLLSTYRLAASNLH